LKREELGIDCGGSICIDCATLCADGIQNGNELGVDCGGSCPTCPPDPTEVCTTATLLLVDGTYTASGPSMGMGATQLLADHANWYYFIPPSNGILSINSCGSGVDTRIWVYEGCCNNLISVDASDDDCELFPGGPTWASEINNLPVSQGIVYYFEWDDRWSSNSFDFDFSFTPINGGPIRTPITCPDCPDDLRNITAPAIVVQSESSCTDGNLTGGMLVAPSPSCPATATLFYSIDGGVIFSSDIPAYDQINPMSIHTKCVCDSDPTVFGNSTLILTNPGQCIAEMITSIPTLSQWGKGIFGLLILNLGLLILRWKEDGRGLIVRL